MRTTMRLDDRLVKELMTLTGAKSRTEAIHTAIAELIRRKKLEGLKALSGQIRIANDWRANEVLELSGFPSSTTPDPPRSARSMG